MTYSMIPLPFDVPDHGAVRARIKSIRSVEWANCPMCRTKRVGLVPMGQHLVWRVHHTRTVGGVPIPCRSSGQRLCDVPARTPTKIDDAHARCRCDTAPTRT